MMTNILFFWVNCSFNFIISHVMALHILNFPFGTISNLYGLMVYGIFKQTLKSLGARSLILKQLLAMELMSSLLLNFYLVTMLRTRKRAITAKNRKHSYLNPST